jgi:hypothetical protein
MLKTMHQCKVVITDVFSGRASGRTKGRIGHTSEDALGKRDTSHEKKTGAILSRMLTNLNWHTQMYHASHRTWMTKLGWGTLIGSSGNTERTVGSEVLKQRYS